MTQYGLHKKIRPVNRLDLGTSGIVIFAKCSYIHECLSLQMKDNLFKKQYLALVYGNLSNRNGVINLPIGRKNGSIIERTIDYENGKNSITNYEVICYDSKSDCSLIRCNLVTGRTHQIRVHFSAIGHPLAGDTLYGNSNCIFNRLMLHCSKLEFFHPVTNKKIIIESLDNFNII